MKRLFGSLLMVASIVSLAACSSVNNNDGLLKIVMITDKGTIDDKNFNQGTWEGIKAWGDANGLKDAADSTNDGNTYQYIKPTDGNTAQYVAAIESAVDSAADIIVAPGYLFQEAFEQTVGRFPSVTFIGLDFEIADIGNHKNVYNISYKEEESGFLAGYGAVANGQTSLGFIGGQFVPAVARYGIGYVAGAAYANKALNRNAALTSEHYWYSGTFTESQEVATRATAWYTAANNPTDVIFASAGGAGNSVFNSAKNAGAGKWAIGVDVDQGLQPENTMLLTSAFKGLAPSVQGTLDRIVNADKNGVKAELDGLGGTHQTLGVNENATGLPTTGRVNVGGVEQSTWRFANWSIDEYNVLLNRIKTGEIVVPNDSDPNLLKNFIANSGTLAGFDDIFLNKIYTATGN